MKCLPAVNFLENKSHWLDERMIEYPGCIYFAMNSGRWDGKGVAFFDPSEQKKTVMKLYKITRGQFHDVRRQEGAWYGRTVCLDVLSDNCPVYTLTSFHRLKDNMPCEKYYILIRNALMKNCNWCESEADNYLLDGVSP